MLLFVLLAKEKDGLQQRFGHIEADPSEIHRTENIIFENLLFDSFRGRPRETRTHSHRVLVMEIRLVEG